MLAKRLSERTLLNRKESSQVIEELFGAIFDELKNGEDIIIVGFGKFYLYENTPRPVRNPKTQEEMLLKPYKSLRFKPSTVIKNLLKKISSS